MTCEMVTGRSRWCSIAFPACFVVLLGSLSASLVDAQSQGRYRAVRGENLRKEPTADSPILARVLQDSELSAVGARGAWLEVTVQGWIWAPSVGRVNREGHNLIVTRAGGENLRSGPGGQVIARVEEGCLLDEVSRNGNWVRVRRAAWMWGGSLERVGQVASVSVPNPRAASGARDPRAETLQDTTMSLDTVGLDRVIVRDGSALRDVPGGEPAATIVRDWAVRVLARSGEWVRVQTEGWVREEELLPAAAGVIVGVSGAEVRSSPEAFEGKLVQWNVQFISIQTADELRPEMQVGERYMLARGPLPEYGFMYLILSEDQVREAGRLPPLADLVVIGRIRVGRSSYLGNPVLELIDMSLRQS